MHYLTVILRLLHIVSGAFWFGSAMMMSFFISPSVAATADAGQRFMGHLVKQGRIVTVISALAGTTVIAGAGLYWIDSNGFTSAWQWSNTGLVFGIGGVLGFIGFIFGTQIGTNIKKIVKTGSEIQGKPTADQMNQIQTAQKRLRIVGPISAYSLILAVICMSVARYWF
jgi:MFS family permease